VFDQECRVDLSMLYPDDIAPRKKIKRVTTREKEKKNGQTMDIVQKSLVRSLSRCGDNASVELLEASVADLNPRNMKRQITFVAKRKKTVKNINGQEEQNENNHDGDEESSGLTEAGSEMEEGEEDEQQQLDEILDQQRELDHEIDSPWNQYAWIDEMHLRVAGAVKFDAPMERSSTLSHLIFGNSYRRTTTTPSTWWFGSHINHPDGIDGQDDILVRGWFSKRGRRRNMHTVASNKPHAVIADGEAMQRVPGSLRELVRCCRQSDVPLFVINDPRVWGSNTHSDLASATLALRKSIKDRIVTSALKLKEGSTFERGRAFGKREANIAHAIRDTEKAARRAIEDARRSLKRDEKKDVDWADLSEKELRKELMKRNVIFGAGEEGVAVDGSNADVEDIGCSDAFLNLCVKCLAEEKKREECRGSNVEAEEMFTD